MPRRDQLLELLKSDPDDVFLLYALAMACLSDGEIQEGLQLFDRVIERDPNYVAAYFQKGQVLARESTAQEARDVIRRGIEVARRMEDEHAAGEMTAFLETL
jgi:predicted Zn-dependent protease